MNYKNFGNTGRMVSEIGMGTFYDSGWIFFSMLGMKLGYKRKVAAVKAGLNEGINLIDTAEIYGSEQIVAEAIRGQDREDLFIASKVWPSHLKRNKLIKCAEASLKRLQTSYIDLYQIHFPNPRVDIKETMAAMEYLVDEGKIRYIGLSNFKFEQIEEAAAALKKYKISAIQSQYNLHYRGIEPEVLDYCWENHVALMAYYPLAHGDITRDQKVVELAQKIQKTPAQIALKWLSQREHIFPIPRASDPKHVVENAQAGDFNLTDQQIQEIESTVNVKW